MNKKNESYKNDSVKLITFILLSYIVPIIGIGFSLYILHDSDLENYGSWVKILAMIALCIQLLFILLGFLGWFVWVTP